MTDALMSMIDRLAAGAATPAGWIFCSLIALTLFVLVWNALTARRAEPAPQRASGDVVPLEPRRAAPRIAQNETTDETTRRRAA